MLELRNPHSILAVLETRPKDVVRVNLPPSYREGASGEDAWNRVVEVARKHQIEIGKPAQKVIPRGQDGGRIGGAFAQVRPRESLAIEELFAAAGERAGGKGLWLALDSLQDPHNVGAIFRSAAFFGVEGIVLTEERSAPLSTTAYDVASGGIEFVPFTLQTNLQRAFEKAKEAGLWILGSSEHANDDISKISRDRPWLLVLGNEEKGMRRLTEESCDVLCKITSHGRLGSLNASVAAGILISALKA